MAFPDSKSPIEDGALGQALGLLLGLGINLLVHPGHRDKHGRLHFEQARRQPVQERTIGQRHAVIQHGKIHVARGDVAQRQEMKC